MTVLDVKIPPIVKATLAKYGRDVTVSIDTHTKDWNTGLITTTTVTHSVKAVPPYPFSTFYRPGDVIHTGDMYTLFQALDLPFTPALGIRIGEWTVVEINPIPSGNSIAAWEARLHK